MARQRNGASDAYEYGGRQFGRVLLVLAIVSLGAALFALGVMVWVVDNLARIIGG